MNAKVIRHCFRNGREISLEKFTELTEKAVASNSKNGVFETLKLVKGGLPTLFSKHQQRMQRSVEAVYSEARSAISSKQLANIATDFKRQVTILSKCLDSECAVLRYQLLLETESKRYDNLIQLRDYQSAPENVCLMLSNSQLQPSLNNDGRKSIDRQIYTNALAGAENVWVYDVLLRDKDMNIVEGAKTNVFLLNANTLTTPDLALGGVAGVMRAHVIEMALGLELRVSIKAVTESELLSADSVFVSNAIIGIQPVDLIFNADGKRTKYARKSNASADKNLLELMKNT